MFADTTRYKTTAPALPDPLNNQLWFDGAAPTTLYVMDASGVTHVIGASGGLPAGNPGDFLTRALVGGAPQFADTSIQLVDIGLGAPIIGIPRAPGGGHTPFGMIFDVGTGMDHTNGLLFWSPANAHPQWIAQGGSIVMEYNGIEVKAYNGGSFTVTGSHEPSSHYNWSVRDRVLEPYDVMVLEDNSEVHPAGQAEIQIRFVSVGDETKFPAQADLKNLNVGGDFRVSDSIFFDGVDFHAANLPAAAGAAGTLWVDAGAGNVVKRA